MDKHLDLLATLHIVYHALGAVAGLTILFVLGGAGILSHDPGDAAVLLLIGSVLSIFLLAFAAPGIIGAIGLIKRKRWSRIVLLVVGFFGLPNLPLGTALGIYTFWVLMRDDTVRVLV